MISGFLVRHDGALISIDHIIWIELYKEGKFKVNGIEVGPESGYCDIVIHMIEGQRVVWNKEPRRQPEAIALLRELAQLVRKAIEL